jgi:hypothetical protein
MKKMSIKIGRGGITGPPHKKSGEGFHLQCRTRVLINHHSFPMQMEYEGDRPPLLRRCLSCPLSHPRNIDKNIGTLFTSEESARGGRDAEAVLNNQGDFQLSQSRLGMRAK